ncbi:MULTISPECIES: hypothetical protein, partial [unclassified Microcoleus]
PAAIARDAEVTAAVAAHAAASDPHAQYLLQSEGDARYRQSSVALADADIPAAIARDAEVTAAVAAHAAASDPHAQYLLQSEGDERYVQSLRAIYTSNCPTSANNTTSIPHKLVVARITSFTAFATLYAGTINEIRIQPGGGTPTWIGPNFYYTVDIGWSYINIRSSMNSAGVAGAPVTVVVDYI